MCRTDDSSDGETRRIRPPRAAAGPLTGPLRTYGPRGTLRGVTARQPRVSSHHLTLGKTHHDSHHHLYPLSTTPAGHLRNTLVRPEPGDHRHRLNCCIISQTGDWPQATQLPIKHSAIILFSAGGNVLMVEIGGLISTSYALHE